MITTPLDAVIDKLKAPPRVLVVEDDCVNRQLARALLERVGCSDIREASTLDEAKEQCEEADLILLDVRFPNSGAHFLEYLHGRNHQAMVVLVMAYDGPELQSLLRGVGGYVKIISNPLSVKAVEDMLHDYRAASLVRSRW